MTALTKKPTVMDRWKTQDLPLFCANAGNASQIARSKSGSRTKLALGKKGG